MTAFNNVTVGDDVTIAIDDKACASSCHPGITGGVHPDRTYMLPIPDDSQHFSRGSIFNCVPHEAILPFTDGLPFAVVLMGTGICVGALTVYLAVLKFTYVLASVRKCVSALAMIPAIPPLTDVLVSTGVGVGRVTIMKIGTPTFWAVIPPCGGSSVAMPSPNRPDIWTQAI